MRFLRLLTSALAIIPMQAYAAPFSCPAPGVVAEMSDGSKFEFQGSMPADPDICVWQTVKAGKTAESHFIFSIFSMNNEQVEPSQMRQVLQAVFDPSAAGRVSAVVNGGGWNSSMKTVVTKYDESVVVPAGTFSTIVVKIEGTGVFGNESRVSSMYYLDQNSHVPLLIQENINGHDFVLHAVKLTVPGH